jgi:hypothetical protein
VRVGSLALVLLGLIACGDREGPGEGLLVGEWQWLETSGGFTGEIRTNPEHRWRLRFDRDGSVREEYAGRPAASARYDISTSDGPPAGDARMLELRGDDLVMIQDAPFQVSFVADTLLLRSVAADGFDYRFLRVGER